MIRIELKVKDKNAQGISVWKPITIIEKEIINYPEERVLQIISEELNIMINQLQDAINDAVNKAKERNNGQK